MATNDRLELHEKLVEILGSRNVYYQPPENIKLKYPCIIYELDRIVSSNSNNNKYKKDKSYSVTLVHNDPDNDIYDKIHDLQYCSLNNIFVTGGLYHYSFTLFD